MTNDVRCLLEELERWKDPNHVPPGQVALRAALESPRHQHLGERVRAALAAAAPLPMAWPLPPPC
ncbi:MAG: hypothetical protein JWM27_4886 [Gemmatimonadetes bacterium]|nr:hypothetical protein [Gemmatimonadota bacterium]